MVIPYEYFNPELTVDQEIVKETHDVLTQVYQPVLLKKKDWMCEAHEHARTAEGFRFHSFKGVHPADYIDYIKCGRPRYQAEIIPALMAYSATIHDKLNSHTISENAFALLKAFGGYMPHINRVVVPVCSAENKHCMEQARKATAALTGSLQRPPLVDWALSRQYTTADMKPMCRRCGASKAIKMRERMWLRVSATSGSLS